MGGEGEASEVCLSVFGAMQRRVRRTHPRSCARSVSRAHPDQGGGDIGVGDPAGEDQRLLLHQVEHIWDGAFLLHKRLLAV